MLGDFLKLKVGAQTVSAVFADGAPSLNLDFLGQRYSQCLIGKAFADIFTFSRTTGGTRINESGVLELVAANQPRFDFDPVTLQPKGLLIEEQRTNEITNSVFSDASPGQFPSGTTAAPVNGVAMELVATGSANGVSYIDVRVHGTPTASGLSQLMFGVMPTTAGVTWTMSCAAQVVGGSLLNATNLRTAINFVKGDWSCLNETGFDKGLIVTNPVLLESIAEVNAAAPALAELAIPFVKVDYQAGMPIDFVLRIAAPQFERGVGRSSFIPTSGSQVARAADVCSINTLSPWYNAAEGTLFAEFGLLAHPPALFYPGMSFSGAGSTEKIGFYCTSGASIVTGMVRKGGAAQYEANAGSAAFPSSVKAALAFKAGNFRLATNGALGPLVSSGTVPAVTSLKLTVLDNPMNCYLRLVRHFPRRIADSQLQAITA